MNQEAGAMIAGNRFSKLLQGPSCGRMSGDVTVQNAASVDFHNHEDIQPAEACRDRRQEISGHHGLGVIPDEASPVLRGGSAPALRISALRPVRPHRPGRYPDPEPSPTTPPLPAPRPRSDSPAPSTGEDPPESAVFPNATSTATIA